jgi:enamine deaminase RidA (YjgF/YER057c/UK114 family)
LVEGVLTFTLDGEATTVGPGGYAFVPPGVVHGFANQNEAPAKYFGVASPAGLEDYFAELQEVIKQEPAWPPRNMETVVALMQRTLYCSGQAANDASGAAVLAGDLRGQIDLALDNLETVLSAAGFSFADIVRLNIFTTDVDLFFAHYDAFIGRLAEAGCRHTGSLIGVVRLAFPEMMVELEATAVA